MAGSVSNTRKLFPPSYSIRFIEGPLDGHRETFSIAPQHLPVDMLCLICNGFLATLNSEGNSSKQAVSSIAVYELLFDDGVWEYHFVGSLPPGFLSRASFSACSGIQHQKR
jgi:hypothetical protein